MSEHPIQGIMGVTMDKIKEMVDVNTIIGEPIKVGETTVIIPVSKVSVGFASGGSDLPTKSQNELFGGAGGAGITIQPVAFIVVNNGEVKMLQMSMNASSANAIVNMVPDVVDKITGLFNKEEETHTKHKIKEEKK